MLKLIYNDICKGSPFHAALIQIRRPRERAGPHTHDFYEMMYVEHSGGLHVVERDERPMKAGELMFIRPWDAHVVAGGREPAHFINLAFPANLWKSFCDLVEVDPDRPSLTLPIGPAPTVRIAAENIPKCAAAFRTALANFQAGATRLQFCGHMQAILTAIDGQGSLERALVPSSPDWLRTACLALQSPENRNANVARFAEIACVSREHLARSLKLATGKTPTEYLSDLRVAQAAALLTGTDMPIIEIALECGFENLSYFYRRFRAAYRQTPRAYRKQRQDAVLP